MPETLDQALAALRHSPVIPPAMGTDFYGAFTAVRDAEAEAFQGQDPEVIALPTGGATDPLRARQLLTPDREPRNLVQPTGGLHDCQTGTR